MKNQPNYIQLYKSGELQRRVEIALQSLEKCNICPWECHKNRLLSQKSLCRAGRYARVYSYAPNLGEEDCLRGWNGSGTIFFSGCNLRCVFCQNHEISHKESGMVATPDRLAGMMLELQERDCHNINLVSPEHVVPQILEALPVAIHEGLRLPIVYNSSGFDSYESLKLMDGIVDIYMPDFKFWNEDKAQKYLKSHIYPKYARCAIREMHGQVGDLVLDENGLAVRGLLVRHLVIPDCIDDSNHIMEFLAKDISTNTYINIMDQYHPENLVNSEHYVEINRRVTYKELFQVYSSARQYGLYRFDRDSISL